MVAALASPAWASIGIRNDTLRNYQTTLSRRGWKVRSGRALMEWPGCAGSGQPAERINQTTLEHSINQLIDDVVETFSKEDVDKVTPETKREVARIAREAIAKGVRESKTTLQTGIAGSLCYRVGVFRYRTYYGPGTGAQAREEWERRGEKNERSGLAPLIALMPKPARPVEAHIWVVNVPADAELFFDGESTTQKGRSRHYTTPALEVGQMYSYKVLVRWQKDGQRLERSCTVSMTGGDFLDVDFFIYQGELAKTAPKVPEVTELPAQRHQVTDK
jgi:uncharacterized protein (TIGR03000 family)